MLMCCIVYLNRRRYRGRVSKAPASLVKIWPNKPLPLIDLIRRSCWMKFLACWQVDWFLPLRLID